MTTESFRRIGADRAQPVEHRATDLVTEWDELVDRVGAGPFCRPGWFEVWWRAFGSGIPAILRVRRAGRLAGVLPIAHHHGRVATLENWHSFTGGLVAEDADVAADLLGQAYRAAPLRADLGHLSTADAELAEHLAADSGATVRRSVVQASPYVRVAGSFEDYLAQRNSKFLASIRQRRRKLEKIGEVRLVVHDRFADDGPDGLDAVLAQVFHVEGMGWKAEQGTAILSDPRTTAFYTDIARWAAARGFLHITTLRLGDGAGRDQPIAAELALDDGRRHYGLKVGFDPEFRPFGPGFLLAKELLRATFDRGLESFEFMGSQSEEKRRWTDDHRTLWHVRAHPGTAVGRASAVAERGGRAALALTRRAVSAARPRSATP